MLNGKNILALIPARAGSKGLPGKNTIDVCGKPLIAWSIEQAQANQYIDRVVVSTDSEMIAQVAKDFNAEVPFLRPRDLAQDTSPTYESILHALDCLGEHGGHYPIFALLEPTSPLRSLNDLNRAIEIIEQHPYAHGIVSVALQESSHPAFSVTLTDEGFIRRYNGGKIQTLRRQELPPTYFFDGSFYIYNTDHYRKYHGQYTDLVIGYPVDKIQTPEIDDEVDLVIVRALMQYKLEKGKR